MNLLATCSHSRCREEVSAFFSLHTWTGGGVEEAVGGGIKSCGSSHCKRRSGCSWQIRRCCSISGVIRLGDPPYGCASLLTVHKQSLFTINPLGPT